METSPKSVVGGGGASESGENIVMKSDREGGSSDAVSLDMGMERLGVVGDGQSESSRDLELGR